MGKYVAPCYFDRIWSDKSKYAYTVDQLKTFLFQMGDNKTGLKFTLQCRLSSHFKGYIPNLDELIQREEYIEKWRLLRQQYQTKIQLIEPNELSNDYFIGEQWYEYFNYEYITHNS